VLVLAASRLQIPAILAARRMGLRVVAADGNPKAPGLARADQSYVVNICDPAACLEVARREKVSGVVHICSEVSMLGMARINEELGLKGVDAATAVRATNKEQMRRAFEAAGAPSPRSIGVRTPEEALAAAETIGRPLIVKPSRNSGKRGVTAFNGTFSRPDLLEAFRVAMEFSRDPSVVIEELVEGPEFSVEILAWNGTPHVIAVTDRTSTGSPHWVETGHSVPSQRTPREVQALREAAVAGARALGIDWAAAHAELKLTPRGPVIIEIGARLGGGRITTDLVPLATGVDMVEGAIRLALGDEPDLTPRHAPQGAAVRFVWPQPGKVQAIRGLEAARGMPGVQDVNLTVASGDTVREIINCSRRVGEVVAVGATAAEAIARAEAARDSIHVVTK
jgi:biotin carboxylase